MVQSCWWGISETFSFTDVDADLITFANKINCLTQYISCLWVCSLHQSQDSRRICIQMKLTATPSEDVSHAVFINTDLHAFHWIQDHEFTTCCWDCFSTCCKVDLNVAGNGWPSTTASRLMMSDFGVKILIQ